MGGLTPRQTAALVFVGAPGLLLAVAVGSRVDGEGHLPGVVAAVALTLAPVAIVVAALLCLGHGVVRRLRGSDRSLLAVATYGFAMTWTLVIVLAIGAWGVAHSYEDFCSLRAGPEAGSVSTRLSSLPPRVSCVYGTSGGRTVVRRHDGDLYAKLGVWLLAFAAAGGSAHLVLTRFGRSAEPRAV